MKILTKQQVMRRIEEFCKAYINGSEAARAIGCTDAQLSDARGDKGPVAAKILKKIGVERRPFYVVGEVEEKFNDGSMRL